jgi:formylglycine-generating enzyme required for sulfatase activity
MYAHALAENLQSLGFEVWIDERLDYGSQWPQELQKQLDSCSAFVLVMSPHSYSSDWVQNELLRARRKQKPIFPLLLEGDEPWLSVESTQYYDVRGRIFPDSEFYADLKSVITSTPAARTLKFPKSSWRARLTDISSGQKLTMIIAGAGILLLPFLGYAILRDRMTPSAPVMGPTATGIVSSSLPANRGDSETVLVPAGEFTMGRKAADELAVCQRFEAECNLSWFVDEEPIHQVQVDAFYIDRYEVTNADYKACEDQVICDRPQSSSSSTRIEYYGNPEFDGYPVIQVNWHQAGTYCEWRGARLPTEAEWEKAARGTDGRMYPWGDELDETFANFSYSVGDTTAVGSYEMGASPYGVYDMAGNVWEWVSSLYRSYPYTANDGRESLAGEDLRVARGGAWGLQGVSVSASYRYGIIPSDANAALGFRCAKDANP